MNVVKHACEWVSKAFCLDSLMKNWRSRASLLFYEKVGGCYGILRLYERMTG
jgi:hypothetical protein